MSNIFKKDFSFEHYVELNGAAFICPVSHRRDTRGSRKHHLHAFILDMVHFSDVAVCFLFASPLPLLPSSHGNVTVRFDLVLHLHGHDVVRHGTPRYGRWRRRPTTKR